MLQNTAPYGVFFRQWFKTSLKNLTPSEMAVQTKEKIVELRLEPAMMRESIMYGIQIFTSENVDEVITVVQLLQGDPDLTIYEENLFDILINCLLIKQDFATVLTKVNLYETTKPETQTTLGAKISAMSVLDFEGNQPVILEMIERSLTI